MKVLVAEKIADAGIEELKKDFEVDIKTGLSHDELCEIIKDYDALIVRSATQVNADVLKVADNLKIVGRAGIGVDNVDVEAATRKGVIVANAPQSNVGSAAEHAIALMLAQARNVAIANQSLRSGKWERNKFEGVEVAGKTIGIVGLGRVGSIVARIATGFNMRVIAFDPFLPKEKFPSQGAEYRENLLDLLAEADFLSVHMPKTKETAGMFGEAEFNAMKTGIRIMNTARGGLFQEAPFLKALDSGKVAGAGIDVFEVEPCTDSPFFKYDQVVVTPHLGASTTEAQDRAGIIIAEQVAAALKGGFVSTAVNIQGGDISEAVKPFLPLAEKLGGLLTHIAAGPVSKVEIEFAGNIAQQNVQMVSVAVLKGMFDPIVMEPVTYVNVPVYAKERGVEVKESKTEISHDYVSSITVRGEAEGEMVTVAGTLVGPKNQERFIGIFDFDVDIVPSRYIAFFRYKDVPGMIGKVGMVLGNHGINIANMQVGRKVIGGDALMGVNVDSVISPEVLKEIQDEADIGYARFIEL